MVVIATFDQRAHLAQGPFAAKYPMLKEQVRIVPFRRLFEGGLDLGATFLFCSVSAFTGPQREAAIAWETAARSQVPDIRILNAPSQVSPWPSQMSALRERGFRVAEVTPLRDWLAAPQFPMVVRQQTPEFQLELTPITGSDSISELLDRLIMDGGLPQRLFAVRAEGLLDGRSRPDQLSIIRLGGATFQSGRPLPSGPMERIREIVDAMPFHTVAFDFLIDDHGPCLWRIDDELCRILPDLAEDEFHSRPERANPLVVEAVLSLDRASYAPRPGSVDIDAPTLDRILKGQAAFV